MTNTENGAILYVFSGTGNTRLVAKAVAEALLERNIQPTLYDIRAPFTTPPDPNDYAYCLFAYPVHAFNAPRFFLNFLRLLPTVPSGKTAYILKTAGEPFAVNSASSFTADRLLRRKGFAPCGDKLLLMPYHILFRYPDALAKQMFLDCRRQAKLVAEELQTPHKERLRYPLAAVLLMYLFRIQWLGARLNGPMTHARKDKCSGCGLCAANCPAGNIRMVDGLPQFSNKCTMCMRCSAYCPADAVRNGFLARKRVNGAYHFDELLRDDTVPASYVNADTRGYFRLFSKYYGVRPRKRREKNHDDNRDGASDR